MAFLIFHEIKLLLPVGCDYRDYRNFFRLSVNRYFMIITTHFALAIIASISYTK